MWIIYLYFAILILSVVLWAIRFRHLRPGLKLLGFTLFVTLSVESFAAYLMLQNTVNLYVYHVLIPIQFVLYSLIFYDELNRPRDRKLVLISIPLYLLSILIIVLCLQAVTEFNSYGRLLKNVLLACMALLYYREVFQGLKVDCLEREPMFWFSTGLFFYSLGNVFVDGLMNHLLHNSKDWALPIYYINVFLGILLHITFLVAFLLGRKGIPDRNNHETGVYINA